MFRLSFFMNNNNLQEIDLYISSITISQDAYFSQMKIIQLKHSMNTIIHETAFCYLFLKDNDIDVIH